MINLEPFAELDDAAHLRIVPVEGGLPPDQQAPVFAVIRELLEEWKLNGVIRNGAAEPGVDAHFILIAYETRAADLSGCTRDQLTHVLLNFEQMLSRRLLNVPRLAVQMQGTVQFMSNAEFRDLRAKGAITPQTRVYDHLISTMAELRADKFETSVEESWYSRIGG